MKYLSSTNSPQLENYWRRNSRPITYNQSIEMKTNLSSIFKYNRQLEFDFAVFCKRDS